MGYSSEQLREDFKAHILKWENIEKTPVDSDILNEIHLWIRQTEDKIKQKVDQLKLDFSEYILKDEYLRSVSKDFSDFERLLGSAAPSTNLTDNLDFKETLESIKQHYKQTLIPLLKIISKLENDYIAITTQHILKKEKLLKKFEIQLTALNHERDNIKNDFFSFTRKRTFINISNRIKLLKIKNKITRLTLHHDKLNLYYFNHNRPLELKDIKAHADKLRNELKAIEELIDNEK